MNVSDALVQALLGMVVHRSSWSLLHSPFKPRSQISAQSPEIPVPPVLSPLHKSETAHRTPRAHLRTEEDPHAPSMGVGHGSLHKTWLADRHGRQLWPTATSNESLILYHPSQKSVMLFAAHGPGAPAPRRRIRGGGRARRHLHFWKQTCLGRVDGGEGRSICRPRLGAGRSMSS